MKLKSYVRTFTEGTFGDMVDSLNTLLSNGITIEDNVSGQVVTLQNIPMGVELQIPHRLGTVPKFRLILRQRGTFILEDGGTQWDDKAIYIKATSSGGASTNNSLTLLIMRG